MKPLSSLFLPLSLFLSLFFHGSKGQNLIQNTCKSCSKDDPNIKYEFCTSSLQAAPASQCATLRGLGMISIRLIRYNITDTRCHVKILLKDKILDPYVKSCLSDCLELYSDAIPSIKLAMKSYNSKKYYDANIQISSVMDAATTCEDGFKDKDGVVSPLTKLNENTFQLSAMALSLMNLIKNNNNNNNNNNTNG
ncbi:putative invertase inhibitor [Solanum stenotomum]|uniref:putative invertase inhibitor n=1 Tax=Solanum stenotomum TaxID=172797 RepID=UPI0020D0EA13|nr:putative invertase inhibitor [Solanum stenotomum]